MTTVTQAGPRISLVLDGQVAVTETEFNFGWLGQHLLGSYSVYLGNIPGHEFYFPGREAGECIFLREAEVLLSPQSKLQLLQLGRTHRISTVKRLLRISPPKACYTLGELRQKLNQSGRSVKAKVELPVTVEALIQEGQVQLLAKAFQRQRPTADQVLDIYVRSKELRSNALLALARRLSSRCI